MATDLETCRRQTSTTAKISPSDHRRRHRIEELFEFDDQSSKNNNVTPSPKEGSDQQSLASNCHTPMSPHHMIPTGLSCPPAPKKRRRADDPACKRKLFDLDFFETEAREEVESLFRPTVRANSKCGSIKRKFTA